MLLEVSQNSQENTCARVSFLIKLQASTLLKKTLLHRCFPVNFAKFLRTCFFSHNTFIGCFWRNKETLAQAFHKKRLWHRCFPVNFAEFLRTLFPTQHFRWPLLKKKVLLRLSLVVSFYDQNSKSLQTLQFLVINNGKKLQERTIKPN